MVFNPIIIKSIKISRFLKIYCNDNYNKCYHTLRYHVKLLCHSVLMSQKLQAAGIPVTVILDSAVGYVMEQVDLVMVGAEGVVESGGIINKVTVSDNILI